VKKKAGKAKKAKATCPITSEEFHKHAKDIDIKINGTDYKGTVKTFSTGKFGWTLSGKKQKFEVNGVDLLTQLSCNLVVLGSGPSSGNTKPATRGNKKKDKQEEKEKDHADNADANGAAEDDES